MKHKKRHDEAADKIAEEIDIVKLVSISRMSKFVAKLFLNKYQRALINSFKNYQVDDLNEVNSDEKEQLLAYQTIQIEEPSESEMIERQSDKLTKEQLALLKEIIANFAPNNSDADMSILYEITGFRANDQDTGFWENYADFDELGGDKLVREDKDEALRHKNKP